MMTSKYDPELIGQMVRWWRKMGHDIPEGQPRTSRDGEEMARLANDAERLREVLDNMPVDAIRSIPKDYCRGCLNSLLRYNRKSGIECSTCYDTTEEAPVSLDDDNYEAIVAILDWAFVALSRDGGG